MALDAVYARNTLQFIFLTWVYSFSFVVVTIVHRDF